jgi:uncharacterized membrane protein SpoIIM required for sporulation
MCGDSSHLTFKGQQARGFAIAGIIMDTIVIIMSCFGGGTTALLGSILSVIGSSLIGCGCCCRITEASLKSQHTASAILNLIGVAVRGYVTILTLSLVLKLTYHEPETAGKCAALTHPCNTFTECDLLSCPQRFFCYPTANKCNKVRSDCDATTVHDSTSACEWEKQAATCSVREGTYYSWCDNDTKDWHGCKAGTSEEFSGFVSKEACNDDLKASRGAARVVGDAILFFARIFGGFLVASTICSLGVLVFGLLTAQENEWVADGSGAASEVVKARAAAKQSAKAVC